MLHDAGNPIQDMASARGAKICDDRDSLGVFSLVECLDMSVGLPGNACFGLCIMDIFYFSFWHNVVSVKIL